MRLKLFYYEITQNILQKQDRADEDLQFAVTQNFDVNHINSNHAGNCNLSIHQSVKISDLFVH